MLIQEGKVEPNQLRGWRYYGYVTDMEKNIWTFTTNSKQSFECFQKGKKLKEMTYLEGRENKEFFAIKRMVE